MHIEIAFLIKFAQWSLHWANSIRKNSQCGLHSHRF